MTYRRDASPPKDIITKSVAYAAQKAVLQGVRTLIPGLVEEYDPATKRAVVQPIIRRGFVNKPAEDRPPLVDVPVIQPSTSSMMVHLPISQGDIVAVVFTETGLSTFKKVWGEGIQVDPAPGTAFVDAVAIPWGAHDYEPVDNDAICLQTRDGRTYFKIKEDFIELKCGSKYFRMTPTQGRYG